MKKLFILIFISIFVSSCATTYTHKISGNITTYNADGSILRQWKNVTIQEVNDSMFTDTEISSVFKMQGLNFFDQKSGNYFVVGNAVPYIIEYGNNIGNKVKYLNEQEKMRYEYYKAKKGVKYIKKTLNNFSKDSKEYRDLSAKKDELESKLDALYKEYYEKYNIYIE